MVEIGTVMVIKMAINIGNSVKLPSLTEKKIMLADTMHQHPSVPVMAGRCTRSKKWLSRSKPKEHTKAMLALSKASDATVICAQRGKSTVTR